MKQLPWYALIVGILIIGGFGWLCYFLVIQSTAIDNDAHKYQWDRLLLVFNTVQAMAAAAVGALLGTSVQQARVQAAEQKAATNEEDAAKAKAARALVGGLQAPGSGDKPDLTALQRILQ